MSFWDRLGEYLRSNQDAGDGSADGRGIGSQQENELGPAVGGSPINFVRIWNFLFRRSTAKSEPDMPMLIPHAPVKQKDVTYTFDKIKDLRLK